MSNEKNTTIEYAQLYNIPRMSPKEIKTELAFNLQNRLYRGVYCIVGEAGLGKSQITHQVAEECGARVCDIRTAQFGLLGAGVPSVKDMDESFFKIKLPTVFPRAGEKSIVLFDEINQGLQHAISMFFSVIEDRRIYDYTLPDDCLVVALMNPSTGTYAVNQIENNPALRRRLKFVYAIPSTEDWLTHARTPQFHWSDRKSPIIGMNGRPCHDMVRAFVATSPTMLYDEKSKIANKPFACPATWQTISLDCYALDAHNINLAEDRAFSRFAASLNMAVAQQFQNYIADNCVVLSPKEFLEKPKEFLRTFEQVQTAGKQPRLIEFIHNMLHYIFMEKYDLNKFHTAFMCLSDTQHAEYTMQFMHNLRPTAEYYNDTTYHRDLLNTLVSKDPVKWREFMEKSDQCHKIIREALAK